MIAMIFSNYEGIGCDRGANFDVFDARENVGCTHLNLFDASENRGKELGRLLCHSVSVPSHFGVIV